MFDAALLFAFLPTVTVTLPPPPVAPAGPVTQRLLTWVPGEVRCDGIGVASPRMSRPLAELMLREAGQVESISYRFAIDETGRTHSIVREAGEGMRPGEDIGPALAASRFPAGTPRDNCAIDYMPKIEALGSASIADLAAYSIFPTGARLPKEGWDRFAAAGNCREKPRPTSLLRAYPDFAKLAATPGERAWSLVAYDTDAKGRPTGVRIAHGTGNADLDAAAVKAVRKSRFTGGARSGCLYPYWRAAGTIAAPERLDEAQLRPANATCPTRVEWAKPPATYYPAAYRKRAIEGWAIVSFDTAPQGEVRNVKILEAQPSADFGQQASHIVRSGRAAPSARGASGCVETVKFMMPVRDQAVEDEEAITG